LILFLGILAFVVILAILVLAHELGHFTFAKLFGVQVDEFGLGFPPRLKTWRRGGTLYSLNAIPLGGFVKMQGENGEDGAPDSFGAKPPWQRLVILVAGPTMNLILAVLILFLAYVIGVPRSTTLITQVAANSPAARAGLIPGDRITNVGGRRVKYFDDLVSIADSHLGHRLALRVDRGSDSFTVRVVPRVNPPPNQGAIGIELRDTVTVRYGPVAAVKLSTSGIANMIASVPGVLGSIGQHGGQGVSGPVGIAHETTYAVGNEPSHGPGEIFLLMALISASVGVLNLLPIPALDGGRIVFVLLSAVRRRNLDPEIEGLIHLAGMAVLLTLIMVISFHDLSNWINGQPF